MKVATYRTAITCLAITAFFTFTAIGIFLVVRMKPTKCPAIPRCAPATAAAAIKPDRDRLVITDPLYPPLNRSEKSTHERMVNQIEKGNLYQSQDSTSDAFRLVGYLTSNDETMDAGRNNWKLFARMKDRHTGEYYIVPTNNTIDLKVPLTKEIVIGERLKDIYTLPSELQFKSPMLNTSKYVLTEIPKESF